MTDAGVKRLIQLRLWLLLAGAEHILACSRELMMEWLWWDQSTSERQVSSRLFWRRLLRRYYDFGAEAGWSRLVHALVQSVIRRGSQQWIMRLFDK